jgi:hypothetical protein
MKQLALLASGFGVTIGYLYIRDGISRLVLKKSLFNAAIPLVLAVMGNYLAAETAASPRMKALWKAVFLMLAALGIGGSLYLETKLDAEHNLELKGMKKDFKEGALSAVLEYNETHPQHPVTKEQLDVIMGEALAGHIPPTTVDKYLNVKDEILIDKARREAAEISTIRRRWFVRTDDNRKEAWDREEEVKDAEPVEALRNAKDIFVADDARKAAKTATKESCDVAMALRKRIDPSEAFDLPTYSQINYICSLLETGNYPPETLDTLADYLNKLAVRLEEERQAPLPM